MRSLENLDTLPKKKIGVYVLRVRGRGWFHEFKKNI